MRRRLLHVLVLALILAATATVVWADKPIATDAEGNEIAWKSSAPSCTKIQDGVLTYSPGHYYAGQPLQVGYDAYGYNYQGHMFNGSYCNVYLGGYGFPPYDGNDEAYLAANPGAENVWCWPYRDVELVMKWDDAWLANTDCGIDGVGGDPDGKLDRHYGFDSYTGSGAWETNHQWGSWEENGTTCEWDYFVKIVAMPSPDGCPEGSPPIWGQFCVIQRVYNSPCEGAEGIELLVPPSGFGAY